MNEDAACRAHDLTAVAEGQVWQKLLLGSGGTYEVAWWRIGAIENWCQVKYPAEKIERLVQ